jgi:hypothetical protein
MAKDVSFSLKDLTAETKGSPLTPKGLAVDAKDVSF